MCDGPGRVHPVFHDSTNRVAAWHPEDDSTQLVEVLQGLTDQVEAAGDADEIFPTDRTGCQLDGLRDGIGDLAHLAAAFREGTLQISRISRSWVALRSSEDDLVRSEIDPVQHLVHVLVLAASEDAHHGVVGKMSSDTAHERTDRFGVVGAVHQDSRTVPCQLHASDHAGLGQTTGQTIIGALESSALEKVHQPQSKTAVGCLVLAGERHGEMLESAQIGVQADPGMRTKLVRGTETIAEFDVSIHDLQRCPAFVGCVLKDGVDFGILLERETWDVLLEDSRFLSRDVDKSVPENPLVVECDPGDRDGFGLDDVRAVEASTETGLDDRDVDGFIREVHERERGHDLEERGLELKPFRDFSDLLHQNDEGRVRNHLAIDADAFAQIGEVGGTVGAHGVPALVKHGTDHGRSRTLADGSSDVDRTNLLVGVTQGGQKSAHAIQLEGFEITNHPHPLEIRAIEQVFHRGGIGCDGGRP